MREDAIRITAGAMLGILCLIGGLITKEVWYLVIGIIAIIFAIIDLATTPKATEANHD